MKKALIALLCATAMVPLVSGLTITRKGGTEEELKPIQEATDEAAAELDNDQAGYYNAANQVHARVTEVTNDTRDDHQLIRMHWTANADVWIRAFKLQFTYFGENRKPIKTETRWMCSLNEDSYSLTLYALPVAKLTDLPAPVNTTTRSASGTTMRGGMPMGASA